MADTNWYPSWYVVQTRTNYESKVAKNIAQLVKYRKMQDEIFDVKILADSEVQIKVGSDGEWKPIAGDWKKFLRKINIESVKIDDAWVEDESDWSARIDSRIEKLNEAVAGESGSVFANEELKKDRNKSKKFKIIINERDDNGYTDEKKVEFRIVENKKLPLYVLVCAKTVVNEGESKLSDNAWQIIKEAGSAYFVGPDGVPSRLSDKDIERYGIDKPAVKLDFNVGDTVSILPPSNFEGHMGIVESVDAENSIVKVSLLTMIGVTVEIGTHEVTLA
ncbi:MAG: hypothetical protein IJZ35_04455 [Clostridia bacterium]|nr:hypothetical protein [Clostridia bacterium]